MTYFVIAKHIQRAHLWIYITMEIGSPHILQKEYEFVYSLNIWTLDNNKNSRILHLNLHT